MHIQLYVFVLECMSTCFIADLNTTI